MNEIIEMALQKIVIEKIEKFGGFEVFLDNVEGLRYKFPSKDRYQINNIKEYYRLIPEIELDFEDDAVELMDLRLSVLNNLKRIVQTEDSCDLFCKFFIDLIEFINDYVRDIRKLA